MSRPVDLRLTHFFEPRNPRPAPLRYNLNERSIHGGQNMTLAILALFLTIAANDQEEPPRVEDTIPLELEGYCPVVLAQQQKWEKGDAKFEAIFEGRRYHFYDHEFRRQFVADPQRYAPYRSGLDIVSIRDEMRRQRGDRRHGVWYRERIFLFANEANLEKFGKTPEDYIEYAEAHPIREQRR